MAKIARTAPKKALAKVAKAAQAAAKKQNTEGAESLLKPGNSAPSFSAFGDTGEKVSLKDFRGKKVVLYFYPKDATPGCTQQGCDFRDNFARVKKASAVVLGVSKDSVASHAKFKEKQEFPFTLISDEDGKICEAYGVWKEKSLYGRKYMGIERSTFLIDEAGKVLKVYPKVKVNGHVDQILEDLK